MGGIRISARAIISNIGPPWVMNEGTTPPYDKDQSNIFLIDNDIPLRISPYIDPTCDDPPCSDDPHTPRLSPNRQWVVWTDFADGVGVFDGSQCLIYAPASGLGNYPPELLFTNAGEPLEGLWVNHPSWHPDGSKIVFTDAAPDNGYGLGGVIKEVTFPGGVATTLWTPQQQTVPPQRENGLHPWYSPDGTMIAFLVSADAGGTCGANNLDCSRQGLWVMDADGSNDMQLSGPWYTSPTGEAGCMYTGTQIAWSNDSEWIAFIQRGYGGEGDFGVYKIRPDGTDETLLLTANDDPFIQSYIGWGAWLDGDEEMIVSHKNANDGDLGISIYRLATDGSETKTMVFDGTGGSALNNNSGPRNVQNFTAAYRDQGRVWWIPGSTFGDQAVASCNIDGTDHQVYVLPDTLIAAGLGFEWV